MRRVAMTLELVFRNAQKLMRFCSACRHLTRITDGILCPMSYRFLGRCAIRRMRPFDPAIAGRMACGRLPQVVASGVRSGDNPAVILNGG